MNRLKKVGAHRIIQVYVLGLVLWMALLTQIPREWGGFGVLMLILASVALLLLVVFGNVGSTWNDKE